MSEPGQTPQARAVRMEWHELPAPLRTSIELRLNTQVVAATNQAYGFSPGVASRLHCRNGDRLFIKAVSKVRDPATAPLYEREAEVAALLPAWTPAPALLFTHIDDEWIVLAFEDIPGHTPQEPWQPAEKRRALDAIATFSQVNDPDSLRGIPQWNEIHRVDTWNGWGRMLADNDVRDLPPWAARHLDKLVELEAQFPAAVSGCTLIHSDLRSDNMLLWNDQVVFVDWAWAAVGADWLDLLIFCIPGAIHGLGNSEEVFCNHPVGSRAESSAVTATLAALAGMYTRAARQPVLPRLPALRAFQRAEAEVALRWLATRTGWL